MQGWFQARCLVHSVARKSCHYRNAQRARYTKLKSTMCLRHLAFDSRDVRYVQIRIEINKEFGPIVVRQRQQLWQKKKQRNYSSCHEFRCFIWKKGTQSCRWKKMCKKTHQNIFGFLGFWTQIWPIQSINRICLFLIKWVKKRP